MRDRRLAEKIMGGIGIVIAALQAFFGFFLLIALKYSAVNAGIVKTAGMANVNGAVNSLTAFSAQAFIAGAVSFIIAAAALFMMDSKKGTLTGIMLILAGAENSVVLFAAGLPAGLILMAAGIIALLRKPCTE
ncbi:hypothetical protein [Sporolactobacillus putidus]|uniref:DUF4064 domain-containing protein n=1 Tax=Sporolactobacillus putidus TaxID=492735 RepID=A0A917RZG6_9BACL|nr:hypothetical protein [Sporolactobacillus putidus]GGL46322.1 hypothetical protein GCM10007968_07980 [Sporolactobacillus putidus]